MSWDDRGELVYIGRADRQVKHLGHRVEMGEIENVALSVPGVSNAAAKLIEVDGGALCLFFSAGQALDAVEAGLRAAFLDRLPWYMVPTKLVALAELPLTPSGKTDYRALTVDPRRAAVGLACEGFR